MSAPEEQSRHAWVLEAVEPRCRRRFPDADVQWADGDGLRCLVVRPTGPDALTHVDMIVGVAVDRTPDQVERFLDRVREVRGRRYDVSQPLVLELVCAYPPDLRQRLEARRQGVWMFRYTDRFDERGGLPRRRRLDLEGYVERQTSRLAQGSPSYVPGRYMPQSYRIREAGGPGAEHDNLLERLLEWMSSDEMRFVLLLSDAGKGKTFVLRELARRLPEAIPDLPPLLVTLTAREHLTDVAEMVRVHLIDDDEDVYITPDDFASVLEQGQIALLLDGFDELSDHNTFETAHLEMEHLVRLARGRAKIVVAARAQHFENEDQLRAMLAAGGEALRHASRTVSIQDFSVTRVAAFLEKSFSGSGPVSSPPLLEAAPWLLRLLGNPRMLGMVASEIDDNGTEAIGERLARAVTGRPSELLDWLTDGWLRTEAERFGNTDLQPSLTIPERRTALSGLAKRLWMRETRDLENRVDYGDLIEVCREAYLARSGVSHLGVGEGLSAQQSRSVQEMAHDLAGTLLVRQGANWAFLQPTVVEYLVADRIRKDPPGAPVVHRNVGRGGRAPGGTSRGTSRASDELLRSRVLTPLMVDILCEHGGAAVKSWAETVSSSADRPDDPAHRNAGAILGRLR